MWGKNWCFNYKTHHFMKMALKFAQARLSPTLGQIAGEAVLGPKSYFEEVSQNMYKEEILSSMD